MAPIRNLRAPSERSEGRLSISRNIANISDLLQETNK